MSKCQPRIILGASLLTVFINSFFRAMLRKENRFFNDMLENIMAYKKQLIIIGIMFLCAFLFLVSTMFTKEPVDHAKTAPYAAQEFVEKNLKSPATAKFGSNPYVAKKDENIFVVKSYVDAQNSFGAMIRENYEVKMRYDESTRSWILIDLKFN